MKTTRKLNRRSFFLTVAGTVAAATTIGLIAPTEAEAMQCTDSDTGSYSDPAGSGRRCGGVAARAAPTATPAAIRIRAVHGRCRSPPPPFRLHRFRQGALQRSGR